MIKERTAALHWNDNEYKNREECDGQYGLYSATSGSKLISPIATIIPTT
jgi:hypothetical protein